MIRIESNRGEPDLKLVSSLRLKNWDKKFNDHKHTILHPNEIDVANVFDRLKRMLVNTEIKLERAIYFEKVEGKKLNGYQETNRKLSL